MNGMRKLYVSSKGKQYLLFKDNLNFEKYLINVFYSKTIKYRTGNHCLPVETGRWDDGIPLNKRKCKICSTDDIGDEYHYLFTCDFFRSGRKLYLKPYYYVKPNIHKYRELFTSTNEATLIILSKFVAIIMYHDDGISVLRTDRSQKEPYQENIGYEEGLQIHIQSQP